MKYRKLGNTNIEVSVIGHGTWLMGNDFFGNVDEGDAVKALHASIDGGVNLIDTAAAYGEDGAAEKIIGHAIKDRRDKVVLATKLGVLRFFGGYVKCLNPAVMRAELELSLKRLNTDYIDLYFIHWPDYNNSLEEALETMVTFKKEGKIRAIGVSNFDTGQIRTAIDIADIAAVQPPLSMLDRSSIENGILPFCAEKNVGTATYGSLGGGILAGRTEILKTGDNESRGSFYGYYAEPVLSRCRELLGCLQKVADDRGVSVAEVSINWVLAQNGSTSALIGSGTPEKAMQNLKAADWQLTGAELAGIEAEYQRIMG